MSISLQSTNPIKIIIIRKQLTFCKALRLRLHFMALLTMKHKLNLSITMINATDRTFLFRNFSSHIYDILNTALQGPSGWHIKTKLEVKKKAKKSFIFSLEWEEIGEIFLI